MKKIGYSFWGYLGDKKYNNKRELVSTPDGNAFYSFSIINAFIDKGYEVVQLMPDRDATGFELNGEKLFESFACAARNKAYSSTIKVNDNCDYNEVTKGLDFVLLEWRWPIEGRNDEATMLSNKEAWQPDYYKQCEILKACKKNNVKVVVFDLDYKLTDEDIEKFSIEYVIELGDKWSQSRKVKAKRIEIPFDFSVINEFGIKNKFENSLVYVGNRYERDWCIDKYIPEGLDNCKIYGNWKESGRDSEERWKGINFKHRLQTSEMHDVYSSSVATILLAKEEYCKYHFMTARIIEAIFYGCVPIFIAEYGEQTIKKYAGFFADALTARNKNDVVKIVDYLNNNILLRQVIIEYMRNRLAFMDASNFVKDVLELVKTCENRQEDECKNNIMLKVKNIDEAFDLWFKIIESQNKTMKSRDGEVIGEVINAITVIEDPTRCICQSKIRNMPIRYAIGELAWYMSRNKKLSAIGKYTKAWERMSDDSETVNSNYGWCICDKYGFNQYEKCKELLKKHPETRQAVIHIKEASDKASKDVNCTVYLQLFIRDGKLIMHTHMRSNDLWMGFPYDIFQFTFIQVLMAMELDLELGEYVHIVDSLHLYKRDYEKAIRNKRKCL